MPEQIQTLTRLDEEEQPRLPEATIDVWQEVNPFGISESSGVSLGQVTPVQEQLPETQENSDPGLKTTLAGISGSSPQTPTEHGLDRSTLRELITRTAEEADPVDTAYDKLYYEYCRAYDPTSKTRHSADNYAREARFARLVTHLKAELTQATGEDEVRERVIGYEFMGMYELLMNGGLDKLYDQYVKRMRLVSGQIPYGRSAELDAKVDLCADFLARTRGKDREQPLSEAGISATVGLELEYEDPMAAAFIEADKRRADTNHPMWNDPIWRRLIGGKIGKLQVFLDRMDRRFALSMSAENSPIVMSRLKSEPIDSHALSATGAGSSRFEMDSTSEVAMNYSTSLKSQLRALLSFMRRVETGSNTIAIHESLGVQLTTEHTEVMDILPIIYGTGYVPSTGPDISEKYPKVSKSRDGELYFPFHVARSSSNITEGKYVDTPTGVTEIRGLPALPQDMPHRTSALIRATTFMHFAGAGVKAVQTDPSMRTPEQVRLAQAWDELMKGWTSLVNGYRIQVPPNSERYTDDRDETTGYHQFLASVISATGYDPQYVSSFSRQTRNLVMAYQKKARLELHM